MIYSHRPTVTKKELRRVETDDPELCGDYWQAVSHKEVVDTIEHELEESDWRVIGEPKIFLSNNKVDMAASWRLDSDSDKKEFSVGVYSSNSGHKRMKFYGGMIYGKTPYVALERRRKHTISYNLEGWISHSLTDCKLVWQKSGIIRKMREYEMSAESADSILITAAKRKLIPFSRIGRGIEIFQGKPKMTAWFLFKAFAQMVRISPPLSQMAQLNGFRILLSQSIRLEEEECLTQQ